MNSPDRVRLLRLLKLRDRVSQHIYWLDPKVLIAREEVYDGDVALPLLTRYRGEWWCITKYGIGRGQRIVSDQIDRVKYNDFEVAHRYLSLFRWRKRWGHFRQKLENQIDSEVNRLYPNDGNSYALHLMSDAGRVYLFLNGDQHHPFQWEHIPPRKIHEA